MPDTDSNRGDSEDEQKENNFAAAVVGGGVGFAVGGPVGAAAGAAISYWLSGREDETSGLSEHDTALLRASRAVNQIADERGGDSASLYMAHLDGAEYGVDAEDGGTRNVLEAIDGDPDLIYSDVGGPTGNMIVEVETATSLQTQVDHTIDQIERYRLSGYTPVLAVPGGDVDAAEAFIDEHDIRDPIEAVVAPNMASLL